MGVYANKDDEKQLQAYKEQVQHLTTYVDYLRTFDGGYQDEIRALLSATVQILHKI